MAERVRTLGEYSRLDRLWLVVPLWDEGDEWEAAEGTAELIIAPTAAAAEQAAVRADWYQVHEMPTRGSFDG